MFSKKIFLILFILAVVLPKDVCASEVTNPVKFKLYVEAESLYPLPIGEISTEIMETFSVDVKAGYFLAAAYLGIELESARQNKINFFTFYSISAIWDGSLYNTVAGISIPLPFENVRLRLGGAYTRTVLPRYSVGRNISYHTYPYLGIDVKIDPTVKKIIK